MQTKKRKWKRRLALTALVLVMISGIFGYLAFTRFHFSTQTIWPLAQLQWDRQTNVEFEGVRPQLIGHRGSGMQSSEKGLIIGNTYGAIKKGIQDGLDWIEIDIRESRDGKLVVFHDETIDLKTDGQGLVSELDLDQLQAESIKVFPPEQIHLLDEVFTECHTDNQKWILDIKVKGIHEKLLRWIDDKVSNGELSENQVMLFGDYAILQEYEDCNYAKGYTVLWKNFGNRLRVLFTPSKIINRCHDRECDYLVLPIFFASSSLIDAAQTNGLNVWVYGADNARDFAHLAGGGVSGFIIDTSEDAKKLFETNNIE